MQKKMFLYGARLREERERLRVTQEGFAALGGVTVQTERNYESGRRAPDAEYLAAIARAGADVLYIVTGVRSVSLDRAAEEPGAHEIGKGIGALSKKEAALLDNYRQSPGDAQDALIKTSAAFAQQPRSKITRSRQ